MAMWAAVGTAGTLLPRSSFRGEGPGMGTRASERARSGAARNSGLH